MKILFVCIITFLNLMTMQAQTCQIPVSEIHEKKVVILNTNLEFSRWVNVLYDEQMTAALIGRLMHHCHLILFPGENNRLRESSINDLLNQKGGGKRGKR